MGPKPQRRPSRRPSRPQHVAGPSYSFKILQPQASPIRYRLIRSPAHLKEQVGVWLSKFRIR